jgi:hypothetical protein
MVLYNEYVNGSYSVRGQNKLIEEREMFLNTLKTAIKVVKPTLGSIGNAFGELAMAGSLPSGALTAGGSMLTGSSVFLRALSLSGSQARFEEEGAGKWVKKSRRSPAEFDVDNEAGALGIN